MADNAQSMSSELDVIYDAAGKLCELGRFKRALRVYLNLALTYDHTWSMVALAHMYEKGEGTPRDMDASLMWSRRGAELGDPIARHNLAVYHRGRGDSVIARDMFQTLLDEGYEDAALELAKMYMVSQLETKRVIRYLERALRSEDQLSLNEREEAETLLAGLLPSPRPTPAKKPAAKKPAAKKKL